MLYKKNKKMKAEKIESLSDLKFAVMSHDEMNTVDGKGWEIEKCAIAYDANGRQVTVGYMQRYRFGKATGEYHAFED